MAESFDIAFDYVLEGISTPVHLNACVAIHPSDTYYTVSGISTRNGHVLPDQHIKKRKGRWVHKDSELESELSKIIGRAIDLYLDRMTTAKVSQ